MFASPRRRPRRPQIRRKLALHVLLVEELEKRDLLSATVMPAPAPAYGVGPGGGWTPAQIRHAYGFDNVSFDNGGVAADGTGETIAIIESGSDPNIAGDLATFDATFGLAGPPSFAQVNEDGGGNLPAATSTAWALETSLDVEWAHAIAPGASILLVDTNGGFNDFLAGINYARNVPGVVAVSMSFAEPELASFPADDGYLTTPAGHIGGYGLPGGVTFVAGAGDNGAGAEWPAVSPNVLSVGGTVLMADSAGNYEGETAWSSGGGGMSAYYGKPGYQAGVTPGGTRTTPDVSYNAGTGFAVYDSYGESGWICLGGTSAGAPQWAALVAIVDQGRALTGQGSLDGAATTIPWLYSLPATDFHDVTSGSNGYAAGPGYDLATGRGSPYADRIIRDLVGTPSTIVGASAAATPPPSSTGSAPMPQLSSAATPAPSKPVDLIGATLADVTIGQQSTIFAVTSGNALYRYQSSWGWTLLGAPGSILSISAAADASGTAVVYAVTADHGLQSYDPATGWTRLGAPGSIAAISAGSDSSGRSDVFAVTCSGGLAEFDEQLGWLQLGAAGTVSSISAAAYGRAVIVARDGSISEWNNNSGWTRLSSGGFARSASAVVDASGNLHVYAVTAGQALYAWSTVSGWSQLGSSGTVGAASAGLDANDQADVFTVSAYGALSGYSAANGWYALTGPGGAHGASAADGGNVAVVAGDDSIQDYVPGTGWMTLTSSGFAAE